MGNVPSEQTAVKDREREFHDQRFGADVDPRSSLSKYYSITDKSQSYFRHLIQETAPEGGRLLEYGCGSASGDLAFNKSLKSDYYGIDLSAEAIKKTQANAAAQDFPSTYLVADAENTGLEQGSFDFIMGAAILHHLDINKSMTELRRLLKPGGSCVFFEPLGYNPAVNLYRFLTPRVRSKDEHPLRERDFDTMRRYFRSVEITYFHCFDLLAVLFSRTSLFGKVLDRLSRLDADCVRRFPRFRKYCWISVIRMSDPV